ncbi:TonB-dependent receptor plug domain-containing protein [Ferruginibacter sp. SUN002]|uniref:TonB-dependent receptor plug domain-containing protein n=1 Tax=Ferruginibacter sp. SUN002 TaxID=2937789 RepID=UPI003D3621D2
MLQTPKLYCFLITFCFTSPLFAQKKISDTAVLGEVVVTATRTEKSIGDIPVPIQVISKKFIKQTGAQKLIDILQQQTGLVISDNPLGQALQGYPNPLGTGIQMQGLDPGYTLILLDGEPLTGRNAGILNLGRIAVGNIQQIEIIKGPATSLYGSDALAGVINIISEKIKETKTALQIHHATNNTWGLTADQTIKTKKAGIQLFANRYSSSGYDLDKNIYGKTSDPYHNYTFAAKAFFDINSNNQIISSARVFTQKQFNNYLIYVNASPDTVKGNTTELDWSFNNQWTHTFNKKTKLFTRFFSNGYKNEANVYMQKTNSLFDRYFLNQFLYKPEIQIEIGDKQNQKFIAGVGCNFETVQSSRYTSTKHLTTSYLFAQKEWLLKNILNITAGARYTKNNLFDAQINPKLSFAYKPTHKLKLILSVGTGYKTPDFRQQFLYFNNALIGYTLLGAQELASGLKQLKQNGEIAQDVDITPYLWKKSLSPEKSIGTNIGATYNLNNTTIFVANIFRNDITHLIERYNLPFVKTNGQSIFCYQNISKVFTQGLDINIQHNINETWTFNAGYQYLDAKDKDAVKNIKNRKVIQRDPVTYISTYTTMSQYGGLFNRSKHSANIQVIYTDKKTNISGSIRATYRGRFGYADINGSQILDDDREYVKGYTMLNLSINKTFVKGFELQIGSDNILNHTDRVKMPNLFGRTYFVNCNINLKQLLKNKTQLK